MAYAIKVISGLALTAITATIGIMIHNHLTPKTIGEELQALEGKMLLDENYEKWTDLITKYESSDAKIEQLDLSSSQDTEAKKNALINKCKDLWNTKLEAVESEEKKTKIMNELKDWCIKDPKALSN